MKTGANSSDQVAIKKLEEQGHSAKGISVGLNIDEKAVKKFMVDPDAKQSVDQGIDTAMVEDLQLELEDERVKVTEYSAKIDELVHVIEGLNETVTDQAAEIASQAAEITAQVGEIEALEVKAKEEGFSN